jgi:hypothetical protein
MIWHFKIINLKTILRPSIVGGMPLKRTHVVFSLNFKCTPRGIMTHKGGSLWLIVIGTAILVKSGFNSMYHLTCPSNLAIPWH